MYAHTIHTVRHTLDETFRTVDTWFDASPELRAFRPHNNGWTIDEILEHIALTNHFLLIIIRKGVAKARRRSQTQQPPDGESDLHAMKVVCDTDALRWKHPEHMTPQGKELPDTIRNRMNEQRLECLALLEQIKNGEGALHTVRMSVGELGKIDMYQWLYFLALHIQRHFRQMNAIRREWDNRMSEMFPATPLQPGTPVADAFLHADCSTFREAARYLHLLPYGRNASRSDFLLVLHEQRGTCSSKHALLAQLARETGLALELVLGIYEMNGDNTPGIGAVLQHYNLVCIPEAHCVVRYNGLYGDITWPSRIQPSLPAFLHTEVIEPWQVADYKVQVHREFLRTWCEQNRLVFDEVWAIREQCIAALAE